MVYEGIICILAGIGAGLGTGFAGLSAAVFIAPMLVSFLGTPIYAAVGISLASDVLASAVSAATYGRKGNLDLRRGSPLLVTVLLFTIVGSLIAFVISSTVIGGAALGWWSIIGALLLGLRFLLLPSDNSAEKKPQKRGRLLATVACGVYIGLVCGFQGTGGGMMLLFVLTSIVRLPFKSAVGTSVFIMSFTALIGAISHFWINGMPDLFLLGICIASTTVFAQLGAVIANRMQVRRLNRVTGLILTISALVMLVANFII